MVTHVDVADQLLGYAVKAQVERVIAIRRMNYRKIGERLDMSPASFSRALQKPADDLIRRLDSLLIALVPELAAAGGLSALAVRLRRMENRDTLTAQIPPTWTRELLGRPAADHFDLLTQGSALLSTLMAVPDRVEKVCADFGKYGDLTRLVRRLILIGVSPPTPRNVDAMILLGSIASYAFELVEGSLDDALRSNPLGFRVWRAITTMVRLDEGRNDVIRNWVYTRLRGAENLRMASLYPARSLDLELAIAVPPDWSPPHEDWVGRVLHNRATNEHATVRERGTAALGLWERAVTNGRDVDKIRDTLTRLNEDFRREAETRGDVLLGLRWIADTLQHSLDSGQPVCQEWPNSNEPCLRVVRRATRLLDEANGPSAVPQRILEDTKRLVEHAVLQNAGVYRRNALDALSAGGWGKQVVRVFQEMLTQSAESWLRCRILFAIGFMQVRDRAVAVALQTACLHAKDNIDHSPQPAGRGLVSEMHAALFAIGDCFGAAGAEGFARELRQNLADELGNLLAWSRESDSHYRVARAVGYLLLVTAQAAPAKDMLDRLQDHPDLTTRRLSEWTRRYLFDDQGTARPLHAACD